MTRQFGRALESAARALFEVAGQRPDVAPLIGPAAALIAMIAGDVDDHVALRLGEAERIQHLLRRARPLMPPADWPALDAALAMQPGAPDDFTLQSMEARAVALRGALIQVQIRLEAEEGNRHAELLDEVWAFAKAEAGHASRLVTPVW